MKRKIKKNLNLLNFCSTFQSKLNEIKQEWKWIHSMIASMVSEHCPINMFTKFQLLVSNYQRCPSLLATECPIFHMCLMCLARLICLCTCISSSVYWVYVNFPAQNVKYVQMSNMSRCPACLRCHVCLKSPAYPKCLILSKDHV